MDGPRWIRPGAVYIQRDVIARGERMKIVTDRYDSE